MVHLLIQSLAYLPLRHGELTSVDYTSDAPGIVPGSPEDFIVNVGDRVYFAFDSFELDADAQELLQDQAAWLKQYNKAFNNN